MLSNFKLSRNGPIPQKPQATKTQARLNGQPKQFYKYLNIEFVIEQLLKKKSPGCDGFIGGILSNI